MCSLVHSSVILSQYKTWPIGRDARKAAVIKKPSSRRNLCLYIYRRRKLIWMTFKLHDLLINCPRYAGRQMCQFAGSIGWRWKKQQRGKRLYCGHTVARFSKIFSNRRRRVFIKKTRVGRFASVRYTKASSHRSIDNYSQPYGPRTTGSKK